MGVALFIVLGTLGFDLSSITVIADLYYEAWWGLKEAGIGIPFPQRDLHLKSADLSLPLRMDGPIQTTGGEQTA